MTAAAIFAESVRRWAGCASRPLVVGLCGSQGSGKSTVAAQAAEQLSASGLRTVVLSLDDFYLPRAERRRLADETHPLFITRGPPGTHDLGLAAAAIDDLSAGRPVRPPRFDKLSDDRLPESEGRGIDGPVDVILFEGWCVGAAPQPPGVLADPVNGLERDEDPTELWRTAVNDALAGPYAALFARLDRLVLLKAPSFDIVQHWRLQQEEANAAAADPERRAKALHPAQVARFIQHYERLTRWMLDDVPTRADLVIALDENRNVAAVDEPHLPMTWGG